MRFKNKGSCGFDGIGGAGIHPVAAGSLHKKLHFILTFFGIAWLFLFAFFPSPCMAESVTLAWDSNTEPDIAGYRVYYRTGSSGSRVRSLYNGTGIENGDSPIAMPVHEDENMDPRFVEITLRGLDEEESYYFVVTAYNTGGMESAPSNEAALVRAVETGESPTGSGSVQSYDFGGGGGGGGCFICSVWK